MILLFLLASVLVCPAFAHEVATTEGVITGRAFDELNLTAYLGIPYAEPPIGDLRFEDARKPSERKTVLEATEWPKPCFSFTKSEDRKSKSENCLFLNILLPFVHADYKPHLLVIFSNEIFDDDRLHALVTKDLGVAVVHFRQGPLGFWALGEKFGNAGTSDVIAALNWLNTNRDRFGYKDITVLAQNDEASTLAHAIADQAQHFARAVLLNGNSAIRRFHPAYFEMLPSAELIDMMKCDKGSEAEIEDCMKKGDLDALLKASESLDSPEAFGAPFRPRKITESSQIYNVIFGVQSTLTGDYLTDDNFDEGYTYEDYEKFLSEVIPLHEFRNAELIRRLATHQYVHTKGNEKDTYLLWTATRKMLLDRDFLIPTEKLAFSFDPDHNGVWLWEYPVKDPVHTCLQKEIRENIAPFCAKMWSFFTRFAIKGKPTKTGCDPVDPVWPAFRTTKRDYHIILHEDAKVEWEFRYHREAAAFWNRLVPSMEKLKCVSDDLGHGGHDQPASTPKVMKAEMNENKEAHSEL